MITAFNHLFDTPENIFYLAIELSVMLSIFAVLVAILIDFAEFQKREEVKKEKKSVVETGTMLLFFFGFYALLRTGTGRIALEFSPLKVALMAGGALLVIAGCAVNVKGRLDLGRNWGNQIRIYGDHTFVTGGTYRLVRHPLYASLVWMFLGASLIYQNYLALHPTQPYIVYNDLPKVAFWNTTRATFLFGNWQPPCANQAPSV